MGSLDINNIFSEGNVVYYHELLRKQPLLKSYATDLPAEIDGTFTIQKFAAKSTIYSKGDSLSRIGILISGRVRALTEVETGYTYMLGQRSPVAFIGAIGYLANTKCASARYEAVTDCEIAFISTKNFEYWLKSNPHFLWTVSSIMADKLYDYVCNKSAEHRFMPTIYLLLKHILSEPMQFSTCESSLYILTKPRHQISEELGIPLKTINRTVAALVQDGAITLTRGKISLTRAQYQNGPSYLSDYSLRSRNGQYLSAETL